MPIAAGPRWFLAASPLHLALWGLLVALGPALQPPQTLLSNGGLWLFLTGFVGFTLVGFAWHLFPTIARRRLVGLPDGRVLWGVAEAAVLLGLVGRDSALPWALDAPVTLAAALAWLGVVATFAAGILNSAWRGRPTAGPGASTRPADRTSGGLFLVSWLFGVAAAALWSADAVTAGPGFGYWIAGVHAFLLGQVGLLIFSVSLRLLPRFVGSDGPARLAGGLAACGIAGAIGMPAGLLALPAGASAWLAAPGALEGLAALLFLLQLIVLAVRASTPRRAFGVFLASSGALVVGGGIGLAMVGTSDFATLPAHVAANLLGFVGLMVLGMWTSMIAPFQFVSHRWSNRVLALASGLLLLAIALAGGGVLRPDLEATTDLFAGLIVAAVGLMWSIGSLPVLYPRGRGWT